MRARCVIDRLAPELGCDGIAVRDVVARSNVVQLYVSMHAVRWFESRFRAAKAARGRESNDLVATEVAALAVVLKPFPLPLATP